MIGYYLLVVRKDVSAAVPLTSLYPALTAVLGFIFLREQVSAKRLAGIVSALISIYLLASD